MWPLLLPYTPLLLLTGIAAVTDTRTGRIPNTLTLPVVLLAPLVHLVLRGPGALAESLAGLVACGLVPYLLFRKDAIGGGDVKLFGAIGAVCGLTLGIEIQLLAFVATCMVALVQLAWQGHLLRTLATSLRLALRPIRRHAEAHSPTLTTLRMGAPIFIASVVVLLLRHPLWWT